MTHTQETFETIIVKDRYLLIQETRHNTSIHWKSWTGCRHIWSLQYQIHINSRSLKEGGNPNPSPYCCFTCAQPTPKLQRRWHFSSLLTDPQQHSPPDGAHPKMLAPDCRESSSLSCLSSCQPCECHRTFKRKCQGQ